MVNLNSSNMNSGSGDTSEGVCVSEQPRGETPSVSQPVGDPVDRIFDRFKSYIDTKLGAFKTSIPVQENSPDTESKKFRREVEAKKLKFKGNEKQFVFNSEIEDHNSFALDCIKSGGHALAQKSLETSLDSIRKRQKLIKLAGQK